MYNQLPSDAQMRADRLARRFICTCLTPFRMRVGVFDGYECHTCWRPIIAERQAAELVRQTLEHCDDA